MSLSESLVVGRWICNPEVPGSNPPPCHWMDLSSVAPNSTPPRFVNREFKQIATAGADTAAGSKFPPKMRHCACTPVASSRSVKSDYVSRDVLRYWLLRVVYFAFLALFNGHPGIL